MMEDDYMKRLGTELLNNEHVLAALNIAVTCYVQAKTAKAVDDLPSSVQRDNPDPEAKAAAAK